VSTHSPRSTPSVLFAHAGAELYGADRILLELAAGLQDRGHALQVVLPAPGPLHAELAALKVPTHRKNLGVLRRRYFTPWGLVNRLCRLLSSVIFMRQLIRTHAIQVVHSNTTAVFSGMLAARWCGVPHVWHVHEITTKPVWFARAVAACVGHLSQRAVFVSEATRAHMCSLHPRVREKAVVIHNGIDGSRAQQAVPGLVRAECGWTPEHTVVGMIGRINWWKGQSKLLDSVALLAPRHASLRCLMVGGTYDGDNQSKDALLASRAQLALTDVVVVQDFRPDVGNVLFDMDIFVLPSTEPDPFPTVVLEAMAAGKPIVAFRHGGVCEMVEDGVSGLLCAPGSATEMAAAIERLLASPDLRQQMGQAGRDRVQRLFTREVFIERFSALYRELAAA
jgi:glycosyltransferase involved in cell wall biosynthesis